MTAADRAWNLKAKLFALVNEFKDLQLAIVAAYPDADAPAFDRYVEAAGQVDGVACELATTYGLLTHNDRRDLFTDAARDEKDQSYAFDLDGPKAGDGFASTLARLREAAGLTLQDLGDAAGLSRQRVHQLETGDVKPTWAVVQALAVALGVSTEVFRDPE